MLSTPEMLILVSPPDFLKILISLVCVSKVMLSMSGVAMFSTERLGLNTFSGYCAKVICSVRNENAMSNVFLII